MLRRISSAHVMSGIALFVALGGGAYAATLPRNSVGTPQLKANAVTTAKVKNGTLVRADFAKGELPASVAASPGAAGAAGAPGPAGPAGAPGADGRDGLELGGFFGTGQDGDQVATGQSVLSRDVFFTNLTINPGVQYITNGYRIFVSGTLTLHEGAWIHANGRAAVGNTPGPALAAGTLGGSGAGGDDGQLCVPANLTNALGGNGGGLFGCSRSGGQAVPPAYSVGGTTVLQHATQAITGRTLDGVAINGGAGGAGAGNPNGGAGGGGAGVVVVAARRIVINGISASITASGGEAGGPDASAGGGGVVVVASTTPKPDNLSVRATGGYPDGAPGRVYYFN